MLLVVTGYAAAFVVFGLVVDSPAEIGRGLGRILFSRDALVTDYVAVGGVGAACVNAGVLTLLACGCYVVTGARVTGTSVAALLLVLGTGLFGKSLINIWCVVGGVALYAWFKRESFTTHIDVAFFGTALAPIFSELVFSSWLPLAAGLPLGIVVSLAIGFALVPVAGRMYTAHQGMTLYNMGFVAGVVGLVVVAVCRSFGLVPDPVSTWGTAHRTLLAVFLGCLFAATIVAGLLSGRRVMHGVREILTLSGRSPTDFTERVGVPPTLVNMGLCGFVGLAYVLLVGAAVNGGVIGALFTIVGFAAAGKHPRNIIPIMVGVFLASLTKSMDATQPGVIFAALFGTSLAPLAGRFGWPWGIAAGALHVSVAQIVGEPLGGLNLYNNGFAAGFVACVLGAVAFAVRDRTRGDTDENARNP